MTTDMQSAINISWKGYGKVQDIRYLTTQQESPGPLKLSFTYDVNASRLTKTYYRKQGNLSIKEYTGNYIRDPQGNPIATYRINNDSLILDELYIYGSSRLGVLKANKHLATQQTIPLPENNELKSKQLPLQPTALYPYTKHYELTDWLGNVRVVISDVKLNRDTAGGPNSFIADVKAVYNYLPFGFPTPGRNYFGASTYRFGFNGQEKDDEITGVTGSHYTTYFRELDSRILRWWTPDPIIHPWESPYVSMGNNPIVFNDPNGDRIRGSREDKKAFKNQMKAEGKWKDIRKTYRGNKRDLMLVSTDKTDASMATATIDPIPLGGSIDVSPRVDWFTFNSGADNTSGNAAEDEPINQIPSRPAGTIPTQDINPTMSTRPVLNNRPQPVNIGINAPFVGGSTNFNNPTQGNQQLQNVANTFLNTPNATQITITIGTTTVNLNQSSTNPDGRTVNQLLWDRGRAMQNQLILMGVPMTAFPRNWLQFAPGTSISTTITVR